MEDTTKAWHDANPNINFVLTDSSSQPYDFEVQWIKDNTGDPWAGEAVISSHIMQVTLGDSFCGGTWQPYSHATLVSLATHELGHLLGLGHSNDINNVMSPNRNDFEYTFRQYQPTFLSGGYYIIPLCNHWNNGAVQFDLVDENTYPVSFFFAPTVWHPFLGAVSSVGTNFQYYTNNGCYGLNVQSFQGTCNGLGKSSYLVIGSPNEGSNAYTTVSIFLTDTTPQPQYYVPALPQQTTQQSTLPVGTHASLISMISCPECSSFGYQFSPTLTQISVGDQVQWMNSDDGIHTIIVNSDDNQYSYTVSLNSNTPFSAPLILRVSTYHYYDEIHPSMSGEIDVSGETVPEFTNLTLPVVTIAIIGIVIITRIFRFHLT